MKRAQINKYLLLTMSLFISGCFEQAPPTGFEAVVPVTDSSMRRGCPNLIDTYRLTPAQEHNRLLKEPVDGKDFSYFIITSLVADQAYNYELRMDRDQFVSKAQDLKINDPQKYYQWREKTLLISKNYSEKILTEILQVGSAYERQGQFHVYECDNGWVKVQQIETSELDSKTDQRYVKQDDVWLARDKYGDLLIHTVSSRQKPGWTFWAAGGAGVNLVRINDQWAKMQKASDSNFTSAWTETDLPPVKKTVNIVSECQLAEYQIVDFNQRLIQSGLIIEQFSLEHVAIKDGACTQPSLRLGFLSTNSAQAKTIIQLLEKDSDVDNIELLETRADSGNLHYLVKVNFTKQ